MSTQVGTLEQIQQLVLDIVAVERNHTFPGTNQHENVAEHSFSVAILCWKMFELTQPPLDISKICKYALVHDFLERGHTKDVNTYASAGERAAKKEREEKQLEKITKEFGDFKDFTSILNEYEQLATAEAVFAWSVDKMQSIILGGMDNWRPYAAYGVTYEQFKAKGEEFLSRCSPYVKEIFTHIHEVSCKTYYDQPKSNA